jgi:hypothetical protein
MPDVLNAIRRLYGEPGDSVSEEMTPEAQAEFAAMADLKAALDRLPPRSPDPSAVDAVVAAAGDAARTAALGPVRAVYGEGEEEADSAEARALAEVKAGLDALPPQRPDPSLIDAVVAAAGEASRTAALAPIRAVYVEDAEPLTTEAAETEAAVLASMKEVLDQLPPRRPDPSVIDAVVAAAAQPSVQPSAEPVPVAATTGRAGDRPARRPETRRRVASALAAVFAVVLVFAGGLWMNQEAPTSQQIAEADRTEAEEQVTEAAPQASASNEAAPEAITPEATTPPTADEGLVAAASPPPAPSRQPEADAARSAPSVAPEVAEAFEAFDVDAALAWQSFADGAPAGASADDVQLAEAEALARDADDQLRLLYLRVREMQEAQAGLGWGTPPVALGAAPNPAPAPTETGWMQVRVQR